ncbi:MAG: hypothetical protein DIU65_17560 [Proteobacteria bacterium]|nr:MAG: hypothetical protein DIU65_17560 [Pseudomonadota bacterium]
MADGAETLCYRSASAREQCDSAISRARTSSYLRLDLLHSWDVGYEDAAAFRRIFKRIVHVTPGAYRRRFSHPNFT